MNGKNITINFSLRTVFSVLAVALFAWLAFALREVFILLLLSFIFAAALDPAVDYLQKKKVPRVAAIAGIYILVILFLVLVFRIIIPPAISQFSTLTHNKELYIDKVLSYLGTASPDIIDTIKNTANSLIVSVSKASTSGFVSGAFGVFSGILGFIVVLAVSFYLLVEKDGPEKFISSYVPKSYQSKTLSITKKITEKMSLWFRGQMLLAVVIFLLDYLALSILKVPFALTLAIIAGFLEILPVIGPIVAGTLAALVALTVSPLLAMIVVVYYFLIQQLENHVLVPQIMKKTLGLNPVVIIFVLLAGGKLLGVLGIIIAVPVAAAVSVLFNELYKNNLGGK